MILKELFNDKLVEEYEMQEVFEMCLGALDIYKNKSYEELYLEIVEIWKTWKDKVTMCTKAGLDYDHARNLVSGSCGTITLEDYVRFKSTGKDYIVIEDKSYYSAEEKKAVNRIKAHATYKAKQNEKKKE